MKTQNCMAIRVAIMFVFLTDFCPQVTLTKEELARIISETKGAM